MDIKEVKEVKRTLLKDIAEKAEVSISLVSFVLNGKAKHYRVADVKAKKILKIAKELNYTPNMVAKGLRSGKTDTLGLIVADVSAPFFAKLARKIEDYAYSKGYTVIISSTDERADKQAAAIRSLRGRGVDGFILCVSENTQDQILDLVENSIPTVLVDRFCSDVDIVSVKLDNFNAAYVGTEHLISQGYNKVAIIAYDTTLEHVETRIEGYTKAINEHNLTPIIKRIKHQNIGTDTKQSIIDLFNTDDRPDAILFTAGQLCTAGIGAIKDMGLIIPKDVAILSFDNIDLFELFYTPISYIEQPLEQFAEASVDILMDEIDSKQNKTRADDKVLKSKLVINQSSLKGTI